MSCCVNKLGSFPHYEDINTGIPVSVSGKYVVEMEYLGTKLFKYLDVVAPSVITIPKPFNENYTYKFKIRGPSGYLTIDGCEDFSLSTFIAFKDNQEVCNACEEFEYN